MRDGPNMVSESTVSNTKLTPSSGERTQRVPLSLVFVCKSELIESFAQLSEFAAELSEFSLPKLYSQNSILAGA